MLAPLPVDAYLPAIRDALARARAVVVVAQPGAGKTTRVPPALAETGAVVLLQPRRVAARVIAQWIAQERGWTVGREVGWQVRFDRRFVRETRLLVVTEGVVTGRFQQDPLLSDFQTIVIDEFHERSIHADLALALARQAWRARSDLRVVVMSATLDAAPVAAFLDDCPVVDVPGRIFPVTIDYAPGQAAAEAVASLVDQTAGDVLCFQPGAVEIQRTIADVRGRVDAGAVDVLPLYGGLEAGEQDRAVRGRSDRRRRVIVATNVAETSLTVPGVTGVVDTGLHKVARYDASRAIDSLTTERVTRDSADQRAGRAGRMAPGVVRRLWDPRDRLRPHREPEIQRIDLTGVVLDVIAWGGTAERFEWFEPPRPDALAAAIRLLERLGAVRAGRLTEVGRRLTAMPLHPRLARMVLAVHGARPMARACALLADRRAIGGGAATTSSDLLSAIDRWPGMPTHVQQTAIEIERMCAGARPAGDEASFRRAVLAGYPDRVAQRRDPGSPRVKLASGAGAVLGSESGVRDGDYLVAVELLAGAAGSEARIRIASRVEREWLEPNGIATEHRFDEETGIVRAFEIESYDALVLRERPVAPDAEEAARVLAQAWLKRGPRDADEQLLRRLRFAGHAIDLPEAVRTAASGVRAVDDVALERGLPADVLRTIDSRAPPTLALPSGRSVRLEYLEDGRVQASVRLQDAFGMRETPRLGPRSEPILFALLAPNGRPVQLTTDLRSFWERTYPEVRKELRGRYPKHRWPEQPT